MIRVVFLTANPSGNAARIVDYLVRRRPEGIEFAGAIVDSGVTHDRRRQADRLRAWMRHAGTTYALWRLFLEARGRLRRRTPGRYHSTLFDLGERHGFPVIAVPNVNSQECVRALTSLRADLGVSIGNRVIGRHVFEIPRQGMINLHHGRIPEFRGGPPAFWELLEGRTEMGISIHRIDSSIDHGEVLASATVPLLPDDDQQTAMERAFGVDYALVEYTLVGLSQGLLEPISVNHSVGRLNTLPKLSEVRKLGARLGRRVDPGDYRLARLEPIALGDEPISGVPSQKEGSESAHT